MNAASGQQDHNWPVVLAALDAAAQQSGAEPLRAETRFREAVQAMFALLEQGNDPSEAQSELIAQAMARLPAAWHVELIQASVRFLNQLKGLRDRNPEGFGAVLAGFAGLNLFFARACRAQSRESESLFHYRLLVQLNAVFGQSLREVIPSNAVRVELELASDALVAAASAAKSKEAARDAYNRELAEAARRLQQMDGLTRFHRSMADLPVLNEAAAQEVFHPNAVSVTGQKPAQTLPTPEPAASRFAEVPDAIASTAPPSPAKPDKPAAVVIGRMESRVTTPAIRLDDALDASEPKVRRVPSVASQPPPGPVKTTAPPPERVLQSVAPVSAQRESSPSSNLWEDFSDIPIPAPRLDVEGSRAALAGSGISGRRSAFWEILKILSGWRIVSPLLSLLAWPLKLRRHRELHLTSGELVAVSSNQFMGKTISEQSTWYPLRDLVATGEGRSHRGAFLILGWIGLFAGVLLGTLMAMDGIRNSDIGLVGLGLLFAILGFAWDTLCYFFYLRGGATSVVTFEFRNGYTLHVEGAHVVAAEQFVRKVKEARDRAQARKQSEPDEAYEGAPAPQGAGG
ncbi:MAG: hypothetical protein GMKNLPBB_03203 [Myxococcota bacterium]|nr:hypothetical protein [Myxococcota bacterium]